MVAAASPARNARERVRTELVNEIKTVARQHLAEHGSGALSLRAIAREVGMVSSAVYRYFPSRDELLTALIVDAYVAFGTAATDTERSVRRSDVAGRWLALCRGAREWSLAAPQEYALIFGSPVPGYAAPTTTIDPATMVPLLMMSIVADSVAVCAEAPLPDRPMPRQVRADMHALARAVAPDVPEHLLARGVMAWTQLIGSISFELFGHLHNVVDDYATYFDYQMRGVARDLGLVT